MEFRDIEERLERRLNKCQKFLKCLTEGTEANRAKTRQRDIYIAAKSRLEDFENGFQSLVKQDQNKIDSEMLLEKSAKLEQAKFENLAALILGRDGNLDALRAMSQEHRDLLVNTEKDILQGRVKDLEARLSSLEAEKNKQIDDLQARIRAYQVTISNLEADKNTQTDDLQASKEDRMPAMEDQSGPPQKRPTEDDIRKFQKLRYWDPYPSDKFRVVELHRDAPSYYDEPEDVQPMRGIARRGRYWDPYPSGKFRVVELHRDAPSYHDEPEDVQPMRGIARRGRRGVWRGRARRDRAQKARARSMKDVEADNDVDMVDEADGARAVPQQQRPLSALPPRAPFSFVDPPPAKCANCGKEGHKLDVCPGPVNEDGFLPGCPIHNTAAHNIDLCGPHSDAVFFQYAVAKRAGIPPIRSAIAWPSLIDRPGFVSVSFSLTRAFSRQVDRRLIDGYIFNMQPFQYQLGTDPMTQDVDRIHHNMADLLEEKDPTTRTRPRTTPRRS
ncbi:hypothetical protein F4805DRAFT_474178 [Annulohypoxylon moriforme]|nr:hypothetical protein F4805DRAFT_474178 [Annulohypoxylon moriforme]